jgi:hypothetical protein
LYYGAQQIIATDAEQHAAHVRARHCLIDAGSFERRYELLRGNFKAWEEFCVITQLSFELDRVIGYEDGDELIMAANRLILNVFSSGRTYADQVGRDFDFLGEYPFAAHVKKLFNDAHARSLDYRLVYNLRNRAQHRALPVDGFDAGTKTENKESVAFYCSKAAIAADPGKFKKAVLDEAPDKIDMRSILRGYMREVSGVHVALRAKIRPEVDKSRKLFTDSIKAYAAAQADPKKASKTGIGLFSVHMQGDTIVEQIPLLLEWDNKRMQLAEKNHYSIKL